MRTAFMAPAPQGETHVESKSKTYITDRIFKIISLGVPVITNNPGIPELFRDVPTPAILFDKNASTLCAAGAAYLRSLRDPKGVHRMMRHVAEYHSYLSRLHTMFRFLVAVGPAGKHPAAIGSDDSNIRVQSPSDEFGCN
jgi:hypothetical protein